MENVINITSTHASPNKDLGNISGAMCATPSYRSINTMSNKAISRSILNTMSALNASPLMAGSLPEINIGSHQSIKSLVSNGGAVDKENMTPAQRKEIMERTAKREAREKRIKENAALLKKQIGCTGKAGVKCETLGNLLLDLILDHNQVRALDNSGQE